MYLNFGEEGKGPNRPFFVFFSSNIKVTVLVWKGLFKQNIDENMHNNDVCFLLDKVVSVILFTFRKIQTMK